MKINKQTSHPSAFISSTFIDLYEDRKVVAETLKARGLNVNALDIKPASSQTSKNEIISGIRESDFVILLIGDRYGSILKSMTGSPVRSITWWEYETALRFGKPVIAYFKNVDKSDPNTHDDRSDPQYERKRKFFERFKYRVTDKHNPAYYSDPHELSARIDASLISIYRAGVKELGTQNSLLNSKVSQLEAEVNRLKSQLDAATRPAQPSNNATGLVGLGFGLTQNTTEVKEPDSFGFGGLLTAAKEK